MYIRFNKNELDILESVYSEFIDYISNIYKVLVSNINYTYSIENTFIEIGFHTTLEYYSILSVFNLAQYENFRMDTATNKELHTVFNSLLQKFGLNKYISDKLRILFYDYEKHYKEKCLSKLTFLLNKDKNNYFYELKKHSFAYGLNLRLSPVEYSLMLLFKKEKDRDKTLKEINIIKIKEECHKLLKTFDVEDYFSTNNYIFYVGCYGAVSPPDRSYNVLLNGSEMLIKIS